MKKPVFYTELAYIFGLVILAIGTALMERADFGISMVVAPAYLLHLKISPVLPFFSFGVAVYTVQAVIILLIILIFRKVKLAYFFSFATAVLYGTLLDLVVWAFSWVPDQLAVRPGIYPVGMVLCCMGVALLFRTYISPEAYEMFVKEVSAKTNAPIPRVKTLYDCTSCLIAVVMSFAFFGMWHFEGVKLGTVLCALINGAVIGLCTKLYDKLWVFEDRFKLRKFFDSAL